MIQTSIDCRLCINSMLTNRTRWAEGLQGVLDRKLSPSAFGAGKLRALFASLAMHM